MSVDIAPSQELTDRQKQTLEWFLGFVLRNGFQPSTEEMAVGLGMAGRSGAQHALAALIRKGWLGEQDQVNRARCIKILRRPDGMPFTGLRFVRIPSQENPKP